MMGFMEKFGLAKQNNINAEQYIHDLEKLIMGIEVPGNAWGMNNPVVEEKIYNTRIHDISGRLYGFYDGFLHKFGDDFTYEARAHLTKAVHSIKGIMQNSAVHNMSYRKREFLRKYFEFFANDLRRWSESGDVYLIRHPEKPQKKERVWGWSSESRRNEWLEKEQSKEELKGKEWSWEGAVETYRLFSRYFTPIILAAPKPVVLDVYVSDQKRTQMLGDALSKYQKRIANDFGKQLEINYARDTDLKLIWPHSDKFVQYIRGGRALDKSPKDHEHEFEAQIYWMKHPDEFPGTEKPKDIARRVRRFLVRKWEKAKAPGKTYNITVGFSHKEAILPFLVESAGIREFIEPLEIVKYHDGQVWFRKEWHRIK